VVQAAVADVVSPAVAAHTPDRFALQEFGQLDQLSGFRFVEGGQLILQRGDP